MSTATDSVEIPQQGRPAPIVRMFGWSMLTLLAAFLINDVLMVGFGYPSAFTAFSAGGKALVTAAIYLAALAVAAGLVLRSPSRSIRRDAALIHRFNLYLIRAFFWTVLLVGFVDVTIAFMRVENLLVLFMDETTARSFGLARFVGSYVHIPLVIASFVIALFSRTLGFTWLALLIVVAELAIVISRFIFSYEQALMGDLVRYWYAALFLFASAYTLFDDGHVRVDILYAGLSPKGKGFVNAVGSCLLGMTTAWVILAIGFDGPQSIINGPVRTFEITQTGNIGMFVKYQMAVFLGIFAGTMLIQFVSYLFEAVADFRDEPGRREPAPIAH